MSGFRGCFHFCCLAFFLGLVAPGELAPGKNGQLADKSDADELPQGALAQLRNKGSKSKGATYGLAFAPDGRWLMVTGDSPEICLLDRLTGKLLKSFDAGARASIGRAVVSRDGRLLAVLVQSGPTHARVHVWDIDTGLERWRRGTEDLNLQQLRFSPDGRTLALAGLQTIHLWDAASGKEKRLLASQAKVTRLGGEEDVMEIDFSPDGKHLAAGNRGGRIHLWDVSSGKSVRVLGPPRGNGTQFVVCSLRFSPDGAMLACGQNSRVLVWDTQFWTDLCQLGGHDGGVFSLGFSPDSRILASGCRDAQIRLWEVASWKQYKQFKGHGGPVWHTLFSPDGHSLVSGGQDGKVYLWDVFGLATKHMPKQVSAEKLKELWQALKGADAGDAYEAIGMLAAVPDQAVPFLKETLKPATVGAAHVERLLAELNADNFQVRVQASNELAKLGKLAQPALRRALNKPPSEEVRRRLGDLLARLEREPPPPDFLLAVRAIGILEIVGTAAASDALQALAHGAPGAPLTEQAKASLKRLTKRSAKTAK